MPTLLERAKSTLQKTVSVSPEREARLKAAADLAEAIDCVRVERERIGAIRRREGEFSATITRLEKEERDAQQAKTETMVAYAAGEATEEAVASSTARAREVVTRLSDTREMHQAVAGELMKSESEWPPSKVKDLEDARERRNRVFWAAVFTEVAATEAPAGVQEWIRRCWVAHCVIGSGGVQGMFRHLFPGEFSIQETEELRAQMLEEFLHHDGSK